MNWKVSHIACRGEIQRATERESCLQEDQGSKEQIKVISGLDNLLMGEGRGLCGRLSHLWGMKEAHVTDYFISADQKIPD